jgi:hypothetical protein|tara:strand:- start:1485 stop:1856 length:372 start_codon:yes stop_codon:yes gene_type:complete
MNDLIRKKVLAKNWTFNEITNLSQTIEILATDIYEEMKLIERFELIRGIRIKETYVGEVFEDVMKQAVFLILRAKVAETIKNMLSNATINFGGNNNEISEGSMGGKPNKERTTDDKKGSSNEE